MNQPDREIRNLIDYYRTQGAPQDQQMLLALLREVQAADGGTLTQCSLTQIAEAYSLKDSMLKALIRRMPSLHLKDVPHRLEVCGTCEKNRALMEYIEKNFGVRNGSSCAQNGFSYHITGCMKNCRQGPSIRWDGVLHSRADAALLEQLIKG